MEKAISDGNYEEAYSSSVNVISNTIESSEHNMNAGDEECSLSSEGANYSSKPLEYDCVICNQTCTSGKIVIFFNKRFYFILNYY